MTGSEFHDVFFEEAGELLEEMERLLIGLDTSAPDREALDAIFRAAHSIKGGAGTFGFDALQNTTHVMENVLDLARRGELLLDRAAVDRLLEAGDVLRSQLDAYREGETPDVETARLMGELLSRIAEAGQPARPQNDDGSTLGADEREIVVRITGLDADEIDPMASELALFGEIRGREAPTTDSLEVTLVTTAEDDDIVAVLCFIVDADQVQIRTATTAGTPPVLRVTVGGTDGPMRESLQQELAALGEVGEARVAGDDWIVDLTSDLSIEDVVAVLGFEVDAARIAVERVVAEPPAPEAQQSAPSIDRAESQAPAATVGEDKSSGAQKKRDNTGSESTSIRVPTDKIDQIINLVGELVITQSMLDRAINGLGRERGEALTAGMSQFAHNARDLQEAVMSMRMVPMDFAFNRFPRLIRDLGAKLGKQVDLETRGGQTELDKGLIERIMDPMTHLVRNSLDHGIEDAATRRAAGKPAAGRLTLSARHEGGNVVIEIIDDGAGLSRERILSKARSSGLAVSDDMPDAEVWQLIFAPGFSTAETVSDVSGRGVGMDVVKRNITQLGGHVDLQSEQGLGTTVRVILPLTLAIMDGMAIRSGNEVFILPLGSILESIRVQPSEVHVVGSGDRVVAIRGEYLRLVELHRVFDIADAQTDLEKGIVIVVTSELRQFALFVDEVLGQQQVVVKNLETHFRKVSGISAATILGDGNVALILDATALGRPAPSVVDHSAAYAHPAATHETQKRVAHG